MAHKWIKDTQPIADFSARGGSRKTLVWRCTECGGTVQRGRVGMNAIPPSESHVVVFGSQMKLDCNESIAFQIMES